MKHVKIIIGILIASYVVAMPLTPADPLTTIIVAAGIFIVSCVSYAIGYKQGRRQEDRREMQGYAAKSDFQKS